jgi:lipopolysaccharide/colanic/teichoic acid biosynthesis glycosyltransferase
MVRNDQQEAITLTKLEFEVVRIATVLLGSRLLFTQFLRGAFMNQNLPPSRPSYFRHPLQPLHPSCYRLTWRQRKLLVQLAAEPQPVVLPAVNSQSWLADCLKRSPVTLVKLDLNLGERCLNLWADACQQAGKPVFLRLPSLPTLPQRRHPLTWKVQRSLDRLTAGVLLLVLSPLLLILAALIRLEAPGAVTYEQWRVGERGKLFRIIKFRTVAVQPEGKSTSHQSVILQPLKPRMSRLGQWMQKHRLDELPQLINVLRGEMSLIGPRPWRLGEAVRLAPESRGQLNRLPGITGVRQIEARSRRVDLNAIETP